MSIRTIREGGHDSQKGKYYIQCEFLSRALSNTQGPEGLRNHLVFKKMIHLYEPIMPISFLIIAPCCSLSFKLSLGQHIPKLHSCAYHVVRGVSSSWALSSFNYQVSSIQVRDGSQCIQLTGVSHIIYIDVFSTLQSKNPIRHCAYS